MPLCGARDSTRTQAQERGLESRHGLAFFFVEVKWK